MVVEWMPTAYGKSSHLSPARNSPTSPYPRQNRRQLGGYALLAGRRTLNALVHGPVVFTDVRVLAAEVRAARFMLREKS